MNTQQSIVIVNPNRYTGYSYILYITTFLKEYKLVGIWTSLETKKIFQTKLSDRLDVSLMAEDYSYEDLIVELKKHNPLCFVIGDDSGYLLADKLQAHFFPEHCNDIEKYDIRSSKSNYLDYLYQCDLSNTKQFYITDDTIPNIDTLHVLKPTNGAGNENVFFVKSTQEVKHILATVDDKFVLQEYYPGEEYCIEICSCYGIHKCTMASKYKGNYLVDDVNPWREENELVDPSDPNIPIIYEYVSKILNALGVKLGLTWTQVKINNGVPQIIEINFRSQGHGLIKEIHNATGWNYVSESLKAYLKRDNLNLNELMYKKIGEFNKVCVNNKVEKFVESVDWASLLNIKSMKHYHQYASLPKLLPVSRNFKTTIGVIILENIDRNQYLQDYEAINLWKSLIEH